MLCYVSFFLSSFFQYFIRTMYFIAGTKYYMAQLTSGIVLPRKLYHHLLESCRYICFTLYTSLYLKINLSFRQTTVSRLRGTVKFARITKAHRKWFQAKFSSFNFVRVSPLCSISWFVEFFTLQLHENSFVANG